MLDTYSKEELKEVSMLEIAYHILKNNKKPTPFTELMEQVSSMRDLNPQEQRERVAQFYTDINIDGRFVCVGDNQWGLKVWYPVESSDEELAATIKPKKKKGKRAKAAYEDDDLDEDFEDDLDEDFDDDLEDDFDEDDDEDDVEEDDEFVDYDEDDAEIIDDEEESDGDVEEEDTDEEDV